MVCREFPTHLSEIFLDDIPTLDVPKVRKGFQNDPKFLKEADQDIIFLQERVKQPYLSGDLQGLDTDLLVKLENLSKMLHANKKTSTLRASNIDSTARESDININAWGDSNSMGRLFLPRKNLADAMMKQMPGGEIEFGDVPLRMEENHCLGASFLTLT
jgi:hypothetical protein